MVPERLRKRRKEKGLSQDYMAKKLGLTRQGYGHYESGRNEPDNKSLVKIADILDCTTDYLHGRTDDPKGYVGEESIHPISEEEQVFFKDWDKLNEEQREKVMDYVRLLRLEAEQYNKQFEGKDPDESSSKKR